MKIQSKKNVCFVVYDISDMGGTNQVAAALSSAMIDRYNISLLSICNRAESIAHDFNSNLKTFICFKGEKSVKKTTLSCFFPILKYFKKNKIDIAILIGHYPGFILSVLRPFCRTKLIFCDHGALMNQWEDKEDRLMRHIAAKLCHKVITLTERTRQDYIERFKISGDKALCIYNWVEYDENAKSEYDADCKKILSAGRFGKEKGYDMLLEVAAQVLPSHPEWQWHIYGDGETFYDIAEKVKSLGLDGQLKLMGRSNRLAELYKDYGIFVLTSYREGLPLVLLEAKANNLPIVSFDVVTGPAEIIMDGEDGFLIPEKRTDLMAVKLCELMENQTLRKKLSENAKIRLQKFNVKDILKKWVDLIDKM